MADLIIFGTGEAGELAHFYFTHDTDHHVAAFCVDAAYLREDNFCGLPVIAMPEVIPRMPPASYAAFVAVGYTKLNQVRADKCIAMKAAGYGLVSYVSSRATTFPNLAHGDNCFILEDCVIQPWVRIGNHVTMWSGSHVGHHSVIEDNVFLAPRVAIAGRVSVGEGSFLGINATVRDHVRIGRSCVISAGAVILSDTVDMTLHRPIPVVPTRLTASRLLPAGDATRPDSSVIIC
jgi:sugar O-acyltransferase (sialic acid O-acetyltransferase NeuD family)